MRWEELNGDRFAEAVEESQGVCLVPLSVIERHGHHLPLGTDMYIGREWCLRAAAIEPAIVFPDYILTQIPEARHLPGTIAIEADLMIRLLDNVCREIARNGLKKIVLVNAHGGNFGLSALFNMLPLYSPRDYVVYIANPYSIVYKGELEAPWDQETDGHAGPSETSMIMVIRPDLADISRVPDNDEGMARGRLKALRDAGVHTGMWWYADYPTHYAGDARQSDAETGERWLNAIAGELVKAIRAIKADDVTPRLQDEFFVGSQRPSLP